MSVKGWIIDADVVIMKLQLKHRAKDGKHIDILEKAKAHVRKSGFKIVREGLYLGTFA